MDLGRILSFDRFLKIPALACEAERVGSRPMRSAMIFCFPWL